MLKHDIINQLIQKYHLNTYLEIGVFNGDNIEKINIKLKHGVDPGKERGQSRFITHPVTSDIFFESIDPKTKYDIILIDGLHHANQVSKDIENSIKHVTDNGYILLHDCIPVDYESQLIPRQTLVWNGDVWRSLVGFRQTNSCFRSYCIDADYGIGVIENNSSCSLNKFEPSNISYQEFEKQKNTLLNIISVDNYKSTI